MRYCAEDSSKRNWNPKGKKNKLTFTRNSIDDLTIPNNFLKLDSTMNFTNFQKYNWHHN